MFPSVTPSLRHRRLWLLAWSVVAALPIAYIVTQVVEASRNIVFWDEFDTALDLVLRINGGADWHELLQRFFALNNEHRTVTSRLMFAASYWLTGTVNFHVIGAIGNLFLVGACTILIAAVQGWERRVRMGVVLAFLMFQLEHFENFIWSGASIDHFQVVMLGIAAIAALVKSGAGLSRSPNTPPIKERAETRSTSGSLRWLVVAIGFGMLATFTLAHGNLVWPVGALLLVQQRRWNQLAAWSACAVIAIAAFLHGFEFNPGHRIPEITSEAVRHIARYWLALLGAPLTLGDATLAPLPGFALLAGLGILGARGAAQREPVALFSALFAVGALALVAVGRSELAGAEVNSRYMVLGALAWAMLIFMLLDLEGAPGRPFRLLAWLLPALAAFNVSANVKFAPMVDSFVEVRDRAATSFQQFGEDGRGITRLHPQENHADVLLRMAAERGVYRLPRVSEATEFAETQANPNIVAYFDEMLVNERAVTLGGWAMRPGHVSRDADIYVVLRSEKSLLYFSSVRFKRADVAQAYKEPKWLFSGFRAVIGRRRLPAEDFDVGVLIDDGERAEFLMTPNRLLLGSPSEAKAVRLGGESGKGD